MLDISDDHIIDQRYEGGEIPDEIDGVRLYDNQTDPAVIRDRVNAITVTDGDGEYRILFWGYITGVLRVEPEGVTELGDSLFAEQSDLPRWLIDSDAVTEDDLPWWVPNSVDLDPHVQCQHCGEQTPAASIIAPGSFDDRTSDGRFCEECWSEHSPEPL